MPGNASMHELTDDLITSVTLQGIMTTSEASMKDVSLYTIETSINETIVTTEVSMPGVEVAKLAVCGVGLVGNMLSIIVMSHRAMRTMPISHVLLALAVMDSGCLLSQILHSGLMPWANHGVHISEVLIICGCWFGRSVHLASNLLVMQVGFERFVAIACMEKASNINSLFNIRVSIGCIVGFSIFFNAIWAGFLEAKGSDCVKPEESVLGAAYMVFPIIYVIFYLILPFPVCR